MRRIFNILLCTVLIIFVMTSNVSAKSIIPFSKSQVDALIDLSELHLVPGDIYTKEIEFNNDTENTYEITNLKVDNLSFYHVDSEFDDITDQLKDSFTEWITVRLYDDNEIYFYDTFKVLKESEGLLSKYLGIQKGETRDLKIDIYLSHEADISIEGMGVMFDFILQSIEIPPSNPPKTSTGSSNNRPVITLIGEEEITIYQGDNFIDPGATAYDKEDGDITDQIITTINGVIGELDTNVPGEYIFEYNVKDSKGSKAKPVTRIVSVKETEGMYRQDTDSIPVITLLGDKEVNVKVGETYVDAGATAFDEIDGDITEKIVLRINGVVNGDVNINNPGQYIITYDVENSKGAKAEQVSRIVNVYKDHQVVNVSELPDTGQKIPVGYYIAGMCIIGLGIKISTRKKKNA